MGSDAPERRLYIPLKGAEGVFQQAGCLPSIYRALILSLIPAKIKIKASKMSTPLMYQTLPTVSGALYLRHAFYQLPVRNNPDSFPTPSPSSSLFKSASLTPWSSLGGGPSQPYHSPSFLAPSARNSWLPRAQQGLTSPLHLSVNHASGV